MNGLLAIFNHPDDLMAAGEKLKNLKVKKMDAYSPFPVHGLERKMGIKKSFIPYVTLCMALFGAAAGFLFQAWAMSIDWPVNVGGKPPVAWPSFIPVTFETTILFSGVTTAVLIFVITFLFDFGKPVLDTRFSEDRFGILVDETDPHYNKSQFETLLKECNAEEIKYI